LIIKCKPFRNTWCHSKYYSCWGISSYINVVYLMGQLWFLSINDVQFIIIFCYAFMYTELLSNSSPNIWFSFPTPIWSLNDKIGNKGKYNCYTLYTSCTLVMASNLWYRSLSMVTIFIGVHAAAMLVNVTMSLNNIVTCSNFSESRRLVPLKKTLYKLLPDPYIWIYGHKTLEYKFCIWNSKLSSTFFVVCSILQLVEPIDIFPSC
jgi:hypothetical protein